jgi:hypothetical protein
MPLGISKSACALCISAHVSGFSTVFHSSQPWRRGRNSSRSASSLFRIFPCCGSNSSGSGKIARRQPGADRMMRVGVHHAPAADQQRSGFGGPTALGDRRAAGDLGQPLPDPLAFQLFPRGVMPVDSGRRQVATRGDVVQDGLPAGERVRRQLGGFRFDADCPRGVAIGAPERTQTERFEGQIDAVRAVIAQLPGSHFAPRTRHPRGMIRGGGGGKGGGTFDERCSWMVRLVK